MITIYPLDTPFELSMTECHILSCDWSILYSDIYNSKSLTKNTKIKYLYRCYRNLNFNIIDTINSNYKPTKNKNYYLKVRYKYKFMPEFILIDQHYYEYDKIINYNHEKRYSNIDKKVLIKTYFYETIEEIEKLLLLIKLVS